MSDETNGAGPEAANDPNNAASDQCAGSIYQGSVLRESRLAAEFAQSGQQSERADQLQCPGAQPLGDDVYEVALSIKSSAKTDENVLYNLELVYAGGFRLKNLPPQAMQPVMFIECPALLFPFVRRIVADLTREGGFPPLLLDPIDFASLYRQRMVQQQQGAKTTTQ